MTPAPLVLGVDLGGTKTEVALVALAPGDAPPDVRLRRRAPTPRDEGYDAIVAGVASLVHDVAREAGLSALPTVGVGMPGSVTYRRADGTRSPAPLVKNANTTCLNGRPFRDDLAAALADGPLGAPPVVAFDNDANCFALAEAAFGAGRGARVTFGVILGTGVGGGIVLREPSGALRVWAGAQGIAGEWGHVSLDPERGAPCYCGRRGCIETLVSGPALEAEHAARTGTRAPLATLAARAEAGDADAAATLRLAAERLGRALSVVTNVLDPDVVVLGGGVSNVPDLAERAREELGRWIFADAVETRLVRHALGDSAGVLGAALLPTSSAPAGRRPE